MLCHFLLRCLDRRRTQAECYHDSQQKIVSPHTKQGTTLLCPCLLGFLSSLSTGDCSQSKARYRPAESKYIPPKYTHPTVPSSRLTKVHSPPSFRNWPGLRWNHLKRACLDGQALWAWAWASATFNNSQNYWSVAIVSFDTREQCYHKNKYDCQRLCFQETLYKKITNLNYPATTKNWSDEVTKHHISQQTQFIQEQWGL